MEAKERILVGIRLLDHPFLTTGPLTVTGFGRLGIFCDAGTVCDVTQRILFWWLSKMNI